MSYPTWLKTLGEKLSWRMSPGYYLWQARGVAVRHPALHQLAVAAVQRLIPDRPMREGQSRIASDVDGASADLARDGFVRLGQMLNQAEVRQLHAYFDSIEARDPWQPKARAFHGREPPAGCNVGQYFRSSVMQSDAVLEYANDPKVLEIVKRYLGATPTLSDLNAWWSYFGVEQPQQAQFFHRDRDDIRFCKLFVYLTDVGMQTGPHVYVRGSHRSRLLREERRFSDEEVGAAFGPSSIEYFCAPAGSAFIVDTAGLHKGLLPIAGRRLILESHFSLLPVGSARYGRDEKVALPKQFDPYVNRLLSR